MTAAPLALLVGEILPQGGTSHWTDQVTPLFAGSKLTVATMFNRLVLKSKLPVKLVGGITVTEIAFTLTVIEARAAECAMDVAVIVTSRSPGEGGVPGAV